LKRRKFRATDQREDATQKRVLRPRLKSISRQLPRRAAGSSTTKEASLEMDTTSDRSTAEIEKIPDKYAADVTRLLRQRVALATFESFAFRETNLPKILNEARVFVPSV
jgi:hypothetical protein